MVLKLNDVGPRCKVTRRVDVYVPIDVEAMDRPRSEDELFYWRSTNRKHLLEIRMAADSGLLVGIAMVLVPQEWMQIDRVVQPEISVETREGMPIVDVTPWSTKSGGRLNRGGSSGRIDEDISFR